MQMQISSAVYLNILRGQPIDESHDFGVLRQRTCKFACAARATAFANGKRGQTDVVKTIATIGKMGASTANDFGFQGGHHCGFWPKSQT